MLLRQSRLPAIGEADDEEMQDTSSQISSEDWQVVQHLLPGAPPKAMARPRTRGAAFPTPHFDVSRKCDGGCQELDGRGSTLT